MVPGTVELWCGCVTVDGRSNGTVRLIQIVDLCAPLCTPRILRCASYHIYGISLFSSAAPHYLSLPEKVDLCSLAPPSRGQDPVRCLNAVAAAAKEFKKAPKKALGYFLESLWDAK